MAFVRTVPALAALRVASDNGDAYSWSFSADIDTNDTIINLRNDSGTRNLHIDTIIVSVDVNTRVVIFHADICTTIGAAVGAAVTGTNLNFDSAEIAPATCIGDEEANAVGNLVFADIYLLANAPVSLDFEGSIILGINDCIAIDCVEEPTMACATIFGHFEDKT